MMQLSLTNILVTECQQQPSKELACYESGPNDVWSLGVVLVNLTCGRNPWKKASVEDSTFRAYLKDPNFLRTILPISEELNYILRRMFEPNPARRITIPELRRLIMSCPRLTNGSRTTASAPLPTPVPSPPWRGADPAPESNFAGAYVLPQPPQMFTRLPAPAVKSSVRATPPEDLTTYFSRLSTASGNSDSDSSSFSSTLCAPTPPRYSHHRVDAVPKTVFPVNANPYVTPSVNTWFTPFMSLPHLAQKHISMQPLFQGVWVC